MRFAFIALFFAAACGSKSPAATPATPATPGDHDHDHDHGDEAMVVIPDVPWEQLDHEQREAFMKQRVMPAMKPVFQQHDATRYAKFGCVTCHGERIKQGDHSMPNPELPVLDFKDMSKYKPDDVEWMEKQVLPAMADTMKMSKFDPATGKGFGCLACHTMKK